MSWGETLWDQTDSISAHTQKGIEFVDKYASFIKDRADIEQSYAKQLNSLIKRYQSKKKDEDENSFTYSIAFAQSLQELQGIANQHDLLAEELRSKVITDISVVYRELKDQRKANIAEINRLQQNFENSMELMNKAFEDYRKAVKEAELHQNKYEKAEADRNLSRAEVDKSKLKAMAKQQQADDARNSYALQLARTNELQHQHFTALLPSVIEKLRDMDESRVKHLKRLMGLTVELETQARPIVDKCLREIAECVQRVDFHADSESVVNKLQSGYPLPTDFIFIDLSANEASCSTALINSPSSAVRKERKSSINRVQSTKRTIVPRFFNKKTVDDNGKEDFSDLPPLQRAKKIKQKLTELDRQLEVKTSQRDGLIKMQHVYVENPNMGNLAQVEDELEKCNSEIADLEAVVNKFQALQNDVACSTNNQHVQNAFPNKLAQAHTLASSSGNSDASSLCRSNSDVSEGGQGSVPDSRLAPALCEIDACGAINGESEYYQSADGDESSEETVLGVARAKYDFSGENEGTVGLGDGDELLLLERDTGDGWTKVRRRRDGAEGFAPTSYLDCQWYPA